MVDSRGEGMAELVDGLEQALRNLGCWGQTSPSDTALASPMPFCYDSLQFDEWLQWVFIVRIRGMLVRRQTLPTGSDILPLAEVWFAERGMTEEAATVLGFIRQIDTCLNGGWEDRSH